MLLREPGPGHVRLADQAERRPSVDLFALRDGLPLEAVERGAEAPRRLPFLIEPAHELERSAVVDLPQARDGGARTRPEQPAHEPQHVVAADRASRTRLARR